MTQIQVLAETNPIEKKAFDAKAVFDKDKGWSMPINISAGKKMTL